MIRSIEDRWLEYRARCIHPEASHEQVREMRITFYAGFKSMLDANMEIAELTEIEAVLLLEQLHDESRRFGASLSIVTRRN